MAAKDKKTHSDSYLDYPEKTGISLVDSLSKLITDSRDKLIVRLFAETGCTSNELVNIRAEDLDLKASSITIRAENARNKSERTLPISTELSLGLKGHIDETRAYLFSSRKSPRLRTRSIRKMFDKYSQRLGVKVTSRDLRKAYIRQSIREERPIEDIRKAVGIGRLDRKEYLTKDEFERIRKPVQNKRDQLILDILFITGCTLKELTDIKVKDIEFTKNSLTIGAAKQQRAATISKRLSLQVKRFVEKGRLSGKDCLFSTRQSKALSCKRAFQIVRDHSRKAGFSAVNPRILRYSHIAHSLRSNRTVKEIAQQTGIRNLGRFHLYGSLGAGKHD